MRKIVSFTLDEKVIKFIDEKAKKLNMTRSRYIENIILEKIKNETEIKKH
jgi:predicted transcriptional regulator